MTVAPGVDTKGVDIDGAKAAYYGFVRTGDAAIHDPSRDWRAEIGKFARGQAATGALEEIASFKNSRNRVKGHVKYDATVTSATASTMAVRVCMDTRGMDIVDSKLGISMVDDPGGLRPQNITLTRSPGERWFITTVEGFPRLEC